MPPGGRRRLIVNADDFGRSHAINQAVLRAHREGILTTASLMVNGDAFDEAVQLARENPRLGVGLHLALICGRSALPHDEIPGLVDPQQNFTNNPVAAGFRYCFDRSLRPQLRREIDAQFQKFFSTGLRLDHINGHLHLHLHPTIFRILEHNVGDWQITHLRFTRDLFFLNLRLAPGRLRYRVGHAVLFWFLSGRVRRALQRERIRHTQAVFGLLQDSHVDEDYVTRLLPRLPPGDSELYSHPSLDQFKHEMDALLSSRVRALVAQQNIQLIRYQDL